MSGVSVVSSIAVALATGGSTSISIAAAFAGAIVAAAPTNSVPRAVIRCSTTDSCATGAGTAEYANVSVASGTYEPASVTGTPSATAVAGATSAFAGTPFASAPMTSMSATPLQTSSETWVVG